MTAGTEILRASAPRRVSLATAGAIAWPAWLAALLLHLMPIIAVAGGWFDVRMAELLPFYGLCALLVGCSWWLRGRGRRRLSAILEMSGLFYLAAAGTALSCTVSTALALPYADTQLAAADRALGFDWPTMAQLFNASPFAAQLLARAYETLNWAPQLLIVLLVACHLSGLAWRFLTGWLICLLFTAIVYPFFPALAAFHHYGLDAEMMTSPTARVSWELPAIMEALRTGITRSLGADQLTGIVTMPSFHAAGAIMLIHGYAALCWLRWPAAVIGGGMFVAAVPVGGHYLVDIIAGLVLALLSILVAGRLLVRLEQPRPIG